MGIRKAEVLAADLAGAMILTEASTGALAGIRTEILLKELAEDTESLKRDLTETSTGVSAGVRTELLLRESAEDAGALMRRDGDLTGELDGISTGVRMVIPTGILTGDSTEPDAVAVGRVRRFLQRPKTIPLWRRAVWDHGFAE